MKLSLAAPKGFSFLETINSHGWKSLEPFQWNAAISTLSRIELFSGYEPVLINITSSGDAIIVEADGPLPELEARQRVSRMLQMDVPIDGFHQYCAERENLKHIPLRGQGRLLRSPTVHEDVIKTFCKV